MPIHDKRVSVDQNNQRRVFAQQRDEKPEHCRQHDYGNLYNKICVFEKVVDKPWKESESKGRARNQLS